MKQELHIQLKDSMDALHFSEEAKDRMTKALVDSARAGENGGAKMKRFGIRKTILLAAACIMAIGGTVLAGGQIRSIVSHSDARLEYRSFDRIAEAEKKAGLVIDAVEEYRSGFQYMGARVVDTEAVDESNNTVKKWKDLEFTYQDAEGRQITVFMSPADTEMGDISAHANESRAFYGMEAYYSYDEYMFVPPDYAVDEADLKRQEEDPHFEISYGSSEVERMFSSSMSFRKNGVLYSMQTFDAVDADTLFDMAQELMAQ